LEIFELGCFGWEGLKGYFPLKSVHWNGKYPFNPSHPKHPNSNLFQSGNCWVLSAIFALENQRTHGKTDGTDLRILTDFFYGKAQFLAKNQKKSVTICKSVVSVLPFVL
jgi:hypothetical protein